jgi:hypothetical protein
MPSTYGLSKEDSQWLTGVMSRLEYERMMDPHGNKDWFEREIANYISRLHAQYGVHLEKMRHDHWTTRTKMNVIIDQLRRELGGEDEGGPR